MKKDTLSEKNEEMTLEDYSELLKFGCDDPLDNFKVKDIEDLVLKEDLIIRDECYYLIQDIIEDMKIAMDEE